MSPDRKQVSMLFLAVLGRPVESEETVSSMAAFTSMDLLRTLVVSEEFRTMVFAPLSQNLQIPQDFLSDDQVGELLHWAQREGPEYFKAYRQELDTVYSVLDALMGFKDIRSSLDQSARDQESFFARLSDRRRGFRRLIGAVEEINQRSCRGYILDASDPDRDLFVRVRINGLTTAVIPALDFRRDLQDGYGGSGRCGFSFTFSDLIGSDDFSEGIVDLEEASGAFVLLKSERIVFSRHRLLDLRAEVKASLRAYRSEIDALIRQLSVGEGHTASTVKDYAASVPFKPALSKPEIAKSVTVLIEVPEAGELGGFAETLAGLRDQGADLGSTIALFHGDADRHGEVLAHAEASDLRLTCVTSGDGADRLREAILACKASPLVLLAAGERLFAGALAWLALGLRSPAARLAYADSEEISSDGRVDPVFRATFDPDLLLTSREYDTPVCLPARALAELDLADPAGIANLRFAAVVETYEMFGGGAFRHLPIVLSCSGPDADERRAGRERIVAEHLRRALPGAALKPHDDRIAPPIPGRSTVVWPLPRERAPISVIVPTKDAMDMVLSLLASLKANTAYLSALHVFVVSNNSRAPQTAALMKELSRDALVTVVEDDGPFNWSRLNDRIIRDHVRDGLVLCLNNDMICQTPDWDQLLRAQLARPGVGVVGGRLLYPNGSLQHVGVTMHGGWAHEGVGDFPGAGLYRDRTRVAHDAYAVTGAFLGFRKETYEELGGFDVENLPEAFNDVEFCLKCRGAGRRVVYDPAQVWVHFESISRGFDQFQPAKEAGNARAVALIRRRHGAFADEDLTYNPHFARRVRPYTLLHWPDRREVEAWLDAQDRMMDPVAGAQGGAAGDTATLPST